MATTLFIALVLCAGALAHEDSQLFTEVYEANNGRLVSMNVTVDRKANTVHYHMKDGGDYFADIETLEDYDAGFAVSRVSSSEGCFVRHLTSSIDETVKDAQKIHDNGVNAIQGQVQVRAQPIPTLETVVGARLNDFCGELPAYKLVKPDLTAGPVYDEEQEAFGSLMEENGDKSLAVADGEQDKRVTVTFFFCWIFFFFPFCFRTTIDVNTGSTIIFLFGK